MFRPSFTAALLLSLFAVASFTGCKTIYSDTYSNKRNYFKPEKDAARPSELLPESAPLDASTPPAPPPPGLDPTVAPPVDGAAPAAPPPAGAPPAIPGL